MDNIHWVICQVTDLLKILPVPAPPALTKTSQEPASEISWMACAGGKHQLRPTA